MQWSVIYFITNNHWMEVMQSKNIIGVPRPSEIIYGPFECIRGLFGLYWKLYRKYIDTKNSCYLVSMS